MVRGRADLVLPAGEDGPGAVALIRAEGADLFGYGAREAVVRAVGGAPEDRAPFGSPVTAEESSPPRCAAPGSTRTRRRWTTYGVAPNGAPRSTSSPSPTAGPWPKTVPTCDFAHSVRRLPAFRAPTKTRYPTRGQVQQVREVGPPSSHRRDPAQAEERREASGQGHRRGVRARRPAHRGRRGVQPGEDRDREGALLRQGPRRHRRARQRVRQDHGEGGHRQR
ncbi:hypothetical protein [Nocardioides convexus]|uniref:hypothetical protein n=1 Tax=Nocardioides convexus TaxID=2712224 RepID=UPI00241854A6|nr:hypothetical protein [Nocardioides convexus]